jgi:hypothetical protein
MWGSTACSAPLQGRMAVVVDCGRVEEGFVLDRVVSGWRVGGLAGSGECW